MGLVAYVLFTVLKQVTSQMFCKVLYSGTILHCSLKVGHKAQSKVERRVLKDSNHDDSDESSIYLLYSKSVESHSMPCGSDP